MVLVFVENQGGNFKKSALEAVYYGHSLAAQLGTSCKALTFGQTNNPGLLGKYGAEEVIQIANENLSSFDSQVYTKVISNVALKENATVVVMAHTANGKSIIGRLSIAMKAAAFPGVNGLPTETNPLTIRRPVFAGKAFSDLVAKSEKAIISVIGNSLQIEESGSEAPVRLLEMEVPAPKINVIDVKRVEGTVPLPEAELVVSAGRGMKGSENWGIIEELADVLGATTACSRPVADTGWRPHHEHVGQTGIAIRPNLYIAIGISGAIQHLAGVNSSKTIVVINKDPEAPFFKAADYGVLGDLFDVVPKLTAALKKFKNT